MSETPRTDAFHADWCGSGTEFRLWAEKLECELAAMTAANAKALEALKAVTIDGLDRHYEHIIPLIAELEEVNE